MGILLAGWLSWRVYSEVGLLLLPGEQTWLGDDRRPGVIVVGGIWDMLLWLAGWGLATRMDGWMEGRIYLMGSKRGEYIGGGKTDLVGLDR